MARADKKEHICVVFKGIFSEIVWANKEEKVCRVVFALCCW